MTMTITESVERTERGPIWSEILPGLWQGGTDKEDMVNRGNLRRINKLQFESVFTLASRSNPVGNGVREFRLGILDSSMGDFNPERDLYPFVILAYSEWKSGRKTLVRCQAGWNRSGLLTALILIRDGYSPEEAIRLIRKKRSGKALSNEIFAEWLRNVDVDFWRK